MDQFLPKAIISASAFYNQLIVYGPNEDSQQGALWEELSRMHSRWNTAWCVFGDFNTIRYLSERFGCEAFSLAMFAFSDFIEANYLVDLPLEGASFTWFRDSSSDCMSRIDRTWHRWIGWITLEPCLKGFFLV